MKKTKSWQLSNPEKYQKWLLEYRNSDKYKFKKFKEKLRRKNLSVEYLDYIKLIEKQKNLCAICLLPEKTKSLAIDHDHKTMKVRGLLCQKCNRGIGLFSDNQTLLKRAIEYLQN